MTTRRIALIALVFAVLVQTGMVMTYHRITGGCFCHVTGAPCPPLPPTIVIDFVEIASFPASELPFFLVLDLLGSWGVDSLAGSWAAMLAYAAINAIFWFAGAFALAKGITLLARIIHRRKITARLDALHANEPNALSPDLRNAQRRSLSSESW